MARKGEARLRVVINEVRGGLAGSVGRECNS